MGVSIGGTVLVPVAGPSDARATADGLAEYDVDDVVVLHVVEKGEGVPDKTPVEQSKSMAAEAFERVRDVFPGAETATAYRRNVVDGILETADEVEAATIVFRPRGGGRIVQFLAGDKTLRLVTEADVPVVALPDDGEG